MPPSTHEESIFYAALQLADGGARAAYLSSACQDDGRLRQRVERLIASHGAGEFLERPGGGLVATELLPPVSERPGATIGPYKLLEQIGEGGMGLVFMAEQTRPLRRRVALKVIKPGMDTQAVVARFEAERQALALMDHPNIARVYDAGTTESGRPYFVMELVRGVPITEYCSQHELNLGERLELFIEVCQAVQHAHQKGIIHRDLKPTNILVAHDDTTPVPKVIDFGVAKATSQQLTERTLFTHFAQVIGTPLYMSPEQAELNFQDVDTRSDVYSLGVVLYELLTGTTPFDAQRLRSVNADEMRRIIREEEPPKPSTRASTAAAALSTVSAKPAALSGRVASALKGDLDWIVMKSLEKDRRRRYESASALANDLRRHLADELVEACPPSFPYRVTKFARRHRMRVALGLLAGLLVAALGGAAALRLKGAAQQRRTIEQTAYAARTAIQAVDLELADRRAAEAAGLLQSSPSANDELHAVVASLQREIDARRQDRQRFEQFMKLAADGQVRMQADVLFGREQSALNALELYDIRTDPKWLARLNESYLDDRQRQQVRDEAYFLLISLATSALDWNKAAEGVELLELAKICHEPTRAYYAVQASCMKNLDDYRATATAHENSMSTPAESAWDWFHWGRLAETHGDGPEAIRAYEAALRMQPDHYGALFGLAMQLAQDGNRRAEAVQLFTGCIALEPQRTAAYRHRSAAYRAMGNIEASDADLALAVERSANPLDAIEARRARVQLLLEGNDSGNADDARIIAGSKQDLESLTKQLGENHAETLRARHNLGNALARAEPSDQSVDFLRDLIDRTTCALGPEHQLTEAAHRDLAKLYEVLGRYPEAVAEWEIALNLVEERLGTDNGQTVHYLNGRARTLHLMGKLSESMAAFQDALNRNKRRNSPSPHLEAMLANNAANVYQDAEQYDEAIKLFEQSLAINYERLGASGDQTILTASALLLCYAKTDGPRKMLPVAEEVRRARAAELGPNDRRVLADARFLGYVYFRDGRVTEGIALLEDALRKCISSLGRKANETQFCLDSLVEIYGTQKRHNDAIALLREQCRAVKSPNGAIELPELLNARGLACALAKAERFEEAREVLEPYWTRASASVKSNPEETRLILMELAGYHTVDKDYESLAEWERDVPEVEAILKLMQEIFEPDHLYVLYEKTWLAVANYELGQKEEGIRLQAEIVEAMQRSLGPRHGETAIAILNLSSFYREAKRFEEAKKLLEDQWSVWKSRPALDERTRQTMVDTMHRLGLVYYALKEWERAADCFRQLIKHPTNPEDPAVKAAPKNLGNCLISLARQQMDQNRPADAEPLLREMLELAAPDAWQRFAVMSRLGEALTLQNEFEDAEPLLLDGYKGLVEHKNPPSIHKETLQNAVRRLVAFYEATDRDDDAEEWRDKLAAEPGAHP